MEKKVMNLRERYYNDPVFNKLIDHTVKMIEDLQFTPTEIREAAMIAQIIYEEKNPRNIYSDNFIKQLLKKF